MAVLLELPTEPKPTPPPVKLKPPPVKLPCPVLMKLPPKPEEEALEDPMDDPIEEPPEKPPPEKLPLLRLLVEDWPWADRFRIPSANKQKMPAKDFELGKRLAICEYS